MGFRSGTLIPAKILIEKTLPWHQKITEVAHQNEMLNILHSCGNLEKIMPALIEQVKIDAKHSFEDVIEPVTVAKKRWGNRMALIGGIDVDFMARTTPEQVRERVRQTLDICQPGGGYCLGTGNSVTNYIPLDNFLAMLDEGRRYG
jgi:uroporphyrinogen decarboxylase